MDSINSFLHVLTTVERVISRLKADSEIIRRLAEAENMDEAYAVSLRLERYSERCTILTRMLPIYTYHPMAYQDVREVMLQTVPVEIGFTDEGWFLLRMPNLLPKKEVLNSRNYIRSYLYPSMERYFAEKGPVRFEDCILIFRHVYDKTRPERAMRDHDNIETNTVADIVAMFVLTDDGPSLCSHYYCSAAGEMDYTEVYVVPRSDFPLWLERVQNPVF